MIRLNLPRAEKGGYDMNEEAMSYFEGGAEVDLGAPRKKLWLKAPLESAKEGCRVPAMPYGARYIFLKYLNPAYYMGKHMLQVFAEAFYGEFAKVNGFKSANIDFANFSGKIAVLSEAEADPHSHINYLQICDECLPPFCSYDIPSIIGEVEGYASRQGLRVDQGLRDDLLMMLLCDYLTFNADRFGQNIGFIQENGVIRLAKAFDNEAAFLFESAEPFFNLELNYDEPDFVYDELMTSSRGLKAAKEGFCEVVKFTKIFNPPVLSIKRMAGRERELHDVYDEEPCDVQMTGSSNNYYMTLLAKDIAEEMSKNKKLKRLYDNLNWDFVQMRKNIKEQTGLEIPECYADFAADIFFKQKRRIDLQLEEIEELGE